MNPAADHDPPCAVMIASALRAELRRQGLNRRRITVRVPKGGTGDLVVVELPAELVPLASVIADIARPFQRRNPNDGALFPVREVTVLVKVAGVARAP